MELCLRMVEELTGNCWGRTTWEKFWVSAVDTLIRKTVGGNLMFVGPDLHERPKPS